MLAITNTAIITGDGRTLLEEATVLVADGRIAGVRAGKNIPPGAEVLDLNGDYLLPGFINSHVHGVTFGPLFASGAPPLDHEDVRANQERHLKAGTTTVLNVDGFALPEEVAEARRLTPLNIKTSACLTPAALAAARAVDGAGLTERHLATTLEEQIRAGAVAIGEAGSGHTLGGGGSEYMYIPQCIKEETGVEITPAAARALKEAALGKELDPAAKDEAALRRAPVNLLALLKAGLVDFLTTDYGGGFFDPLPAALKAISGAGILSLPPAVRLVTSAPAAAIPGLAPGRGSIAPGYVADLTVLAREDLAQVRYVFIAGKQVIPAESP